MYNLGEQEFTRTITEIQALGQFTEIGAQPMHSSSKQGLEGRSSSEKEPLSELRVLSKQSSLEHELAIIGNLVGMRAEIHHGSPERELLKMWCSSMDTKEGHCSFIATQVRQ